MATRSTPSLLGITIASTGMGAAVHLYAGVSPATAVALTAALTVPALAATVIAALIPHLPAIVREIQGPDPGGGYQSDDQGQGCRAPAPR
jgi:hypothetical protein